GGWCGRPGSRRRVTVAARRRPCVESAPRRNEPTRSRPPLASERGRLRLCKRVVVEGMGEDRRVDQSGDLFKAAQVGGVGHGLGAAACSDDTLGDLVELAVQLGAGGRPPRCVMLVQQGLVLVARRTPTRLVLSPVELEAFLPLPLDRGLFVGPPPHLLLEPPEGGLTEQNCREQARRARGVWA